MTIDPRTPVQRIVTALPTSLDVFRRFGIDVTSNVTLQEACATARVGLEQIQSELAAIDWSMKANPEA